MATSRAELRHAIDTQLRLVHGAPEVARVATGGTTSTVVDTAAVEPENYWANTGCTCLAPPMRVRHKGKSPASRPLGTHKHVVSRAGPERSGRGGR
jgi:hypothetical protein